MADGRIRRGARHLAFPRSLPLTGLWRVGPGRPARDGSLPEFGVLCSQEFPRLGGVALRSMGSGGR